MRVPKETMYDVSVRAVSKLQKPAHRLMKGAPFVRRWGILEQYEMKQIIHLSVGGHPII